MEVRETAGHGNGPPSVPTARQAQARRPDLKPGRKASTEARGTMEAGRGQGRRRRLDALCTTARPAMSSWPGTRLQCSMNTIPTTPSCWHRGTALLLELRLVSGNALIRRSSRGAPSIAQAGIWGGGNALALNRCTPRLDRVSLLQALAMWLSSGRRLDSETIQRGHSAR